MTGSDQMEDKSVINLSIPLDNKSNLSQEEIEELKIVL